MLSGHPVRRRVTGRRAAWLLPLVLLLPLLLTAFASSASAVPLCAPTKGETACVSGTVGSRANPVEGAELTLTAPDGTEQTQTTEADGKFAFEVTEAGEYFVGVDTESLGDDLELRPPAPRFEGPDGSIRLDVQLGQLNVPDVDVRSTDFTRGPGSRTDLFLQGAVDGLRLGLMLALASVGLSLIYGTTGISNFAHAEQVTLGGIVAVVLVSNQYLGLNLWLGVVLTVVITAFSGFLQDVILWRPLRRRGMGLIQLLIVTIGLSLTLQYAFIYFVGPSTQKVTLRSFDTFSIGPVILTYISLIGMGISLAVIALVGYTLLYTRIGQATRAVSDNPALASASGIDVDGVVRLVWTSSAGLAGLSGVLYALAISNGIRWDTGKEILLILFAAVTLGGLGTAFGAFVGSIIIGLTVNLAGPLGAPGDLKYAVALALLIVLLIFRPQGLLGKSSRVG